MKKQLAIMTLFAIFIVIATSGAVSAVPTATNTNISTTWTEPPSANAIQDAIDYVPTINDDVISIKGGETYGTVILDKRLTLQWDGTLTKPVIAQLLILPGGSGSTIDGLDVKFIAASDPNNAGITIFNANNVIVKNCIVEGWSTNSGFALDNADDNTITGNTITGNHHGILLRNGSDGNTIGTVNSIGSDLITGTGAATALDGYGIFLDSSINNTIYGLTIGASGNLALGFTYGIYLTNATGTTIDYPLVRYCGTGISLHNNSQANIINFTASRSNVNNGIELYDSSATINGAPGANNEIWGNGGHGIFSSDSTVDIQNSNIYNNTGVGVFIRYTVAQTGANTIKNNYIYSNGTGAMKRSGISIHNADGTNTIEGNQIYSNGANGINVLDSNVTIQGSNNIYLNGANGIALTQGSTGTITGNSINSNVNDGIYLSDSTATINGGNFIQGNTAHGIESKDSTITVEDNTVGDPLVPANGNGGRGIWIYYTIVNTTNVNTIRKNTISNNGNIPPVSWNGIRIDDSQANNIIDENIITYNAVFGIALSNSHATITNNTVSNNGYSGIGLWYTGNSVATITGNTIQANGHHGIFSWNSQVDIENNTIGGPLAADGNNNNGIRIEYTTANPTVNTIINNQINNNGQVQGPWDGIYMLNATGDNLIQKNTISYNTGNGIYLSNSKAFINSTDNTLANGNNINNNGRNGIFVHNSNPFTVTIDHNTITDNTLDGIFVDPSTVIITYNTITGNLGNGVNINFSTAWIDYNTISNNHLNGISAFFSTVNTITNNEIKNNWDNGILLIWSTAGTIYNNTIWDNGDAPFEYQIRFINSVAANGIITNNIQGNYGLMFDNNTQTVQFNRIVCTTEAIRNTGMLNTINAQFNWYGSNAGPNSPYVKIFNTGNGVINFQPWLVLTVNATPDKILTGMNSTVTADLRHDSTGVLRIEGTVPNGIPVNFSVDALGNLSSYSETTMNGEATTTFTAGAIPGTANVSAQVDAETQSTPIQIAVPPTALAVPPGGYFYNSVDVQLTSNGGFGPLTIYFTTDGTTPTTSSQSYSDPINFSIAPNSLNPVHYTLNFLVVDSQGYSNMYSEVYHLANLPTAAAFPVGGNYYNSVNVNLSSKGGFPTVNIFYSTDNGSTWNPYTAPINFSGTPTTHTLLFYAKDNQNTSSPIYSEVYNLAELPTVVADKTTGYYYAPVTVNLNAKGGFTPVVIFYTTDGSTPTASSTQYNEALTFTNTTTLKYIARDAMGTLSSVYTQTYNIAAPPTVSIDNAGGNFYFPTAVTVNLTSNGGFAPVNIYYTINGGAQTLYTGPLTINNNTLLTYFAQDSQGTNSPVYTQTYNFANLPTVTASPVGGKYSNLKVTLAATNGYGPLTVFYTTDGTEPTTSSKIYTGALTISKNTTLKFFVQDSQGTVSAVSTQVYTIAPYVTSSSPTNNTSGYSKTAAITVTFSSTISKAVNWSQITLKNLTTGKTVSFTKSIVGNMLIIKMSQTRLSLNKYRLTIPASAVKDLNGNGLLNAFTLTFKTKK